MSEATQTEHDRGRTTGLIRTAGRGFDWTDRHAGVVFLVLATLAFAELFYLGRHGSFFQDEWAFIDVDGLGSPAAWLAPHNEHWSTIPLLLYRVVLAVFGLRTHLPYLALLLILHVLATSALFVLLRRTSGSLVALAGSGVFLVLGSASQNLFWAFQIGFVGSCAAGLWAMVMLDRADRAGAASGMLLLLASVMSSGPGLAFLAMAIVELLLDRPRRWMLGWLMPVVLAFGAWFVAFGRSGITQGTTIDAATIGHIPSAVLSGAVGGINGLLGIGPRIATGLLVVGVIFVLVLLVRRQLPSRVVASAAGLVALFVLIAIGREQNADPGRVPRYVYEAAIFVLLGAGALIGRAADVLPGPSTLSRRAPANLLLASWVVALAAVGLAHNQALLRPGAGFFTDKAGELRAYVADVGPPPAFAFSPPTTGVPLRMPPPDRMVELIGMYGSPATDVLWPSVVLPPTAAQRDRAFWRLAGGGATVTVPASPSTGTAGLTILSLDGGRIRSVDGCAEASAPGRFTVTLALQPGAAIQVRSTLAGEGSALIGREAAPQAVDVVEIPLIAGVSTSLAAPTVPGFEYQVALTLPGGGSTTLCSAASG